MGNRHIDGAVAPVVRPLHDLEEETAFQQRPGVGVIVSGLTLAVEQDVPGAQALHLRGGQVGTHLEVVVIVRRNRQELAPARLQALDRGEDVVRRDGDVLDARSEEVVQEAR